MKRTTFWSFLGISVFTGGFWGGVVALLGLLLHFPLKYASETALSAFIFMFLFLCWNFGRRES